MITGDSALAFRGFCPTSPTSYTKQTQNLASILKGRPAVYLKEVPSDGESLFTSLKDCKRFYSVF